MLLGGSGGKRARLYNGKWLLLLFKRLSYRLKSSRFAVLGEYYFGTSNRTLTTAIAGGTNPLVLRIQFEARNVSDGFQGDLF